MNQKEISEIRRHLTKDKNCIGQICGCYVNANKEIIASWEQSTALMPESEMEMYLALFRRTLSGIPGRNLIDLSFSTKDVLESERHKLLIALRDTGLQNAEVRQSLYEKIIGAVSFDDKNYIILTAFDTYDVPHRAKDGYSHGEDSSSSYSFVLCALCPVNEGRAALGYAAEDGQFHSCASPQTIAAPEYGFLFPAFDDRQSNIYNTLFYTKKTSSMQENLLDALFGTEIPMAADEQKDTFGEVLADALEDSLSLDVVQALHEQIRDRITEYKESKETEPLAFDASDVGAILAGRGVDEDKVRTFREKCAESFGDGVTLIPGNLVDTKKYEVVTPEIRIIVDPEYSYLVETRVINGRKYLLIPADEGVEVNGIAVRIEKPKEP